MYIHNIYTLLYVPHEYASWLLRSMMEHEWKLQRQPWSRQGCENAGPLPVFWASVFTKAPRGGSQVTRNAIKAARISNTISHQRTLWQLKKDATHATVSISGKDHEIWNGLVTISCEQAQRAFGCDEVTLSVLFMAEDVMEEKDEWFYKWLKNVQAAHDAGQVLIIYERRGWDSTKIGARQVTDKDGASTAIGRYERAQFREIGWINGQKFDTSRIEYRKLDAMDAAHSETASLNP